MNTTYPEKYSPKTRSNAIFSQPSSTKEKVKKESQVLVV